MKAADILARMRLRRVDEGDPEHEKQAAADAEALKQMAVSFDGTAGLTFATPFHEKAFYDAFPELRPSVDSEVPARENLAATARIDAAWAKIAACGIDAETMQRLDEECVPTQREDDPELYATQLEQLALKLERAFADAAAAHEASRAKPPAPFDPKKAESPLHSPIDWGKRTQTTEPSKSKRGRKKHGE